jgi:hypothetical protein
VASTSPGPHTRKQRLTQAIDDAHNNVDNFDLNTEGKKFGEYMSEDITTGQQRAHVPWNVGQFPGQNLDRLPENSLCTTDNLTGCRMHQSGNKLHHVDAKVDAREFYNPQNHAGHQPGVPQSASSGGILQRKGRPGHWDDVDKFAPNIRRNSYGNADGTGEAIFAMHKKDGKWRGAYRDTSKGSKWKPFNTGPVSIPDQGPNGYKDTSEKVVASKQAWVPSWKKRQMQEAAASSSSAVDTGKSQSPERKKSVSPSREEKTRGRSRTRSPPKPRSPDRSENRRGRSRERKENTGAKSKIRERAPSRPRGSARKGEDKSRGSPSNNGSNPDQSPKKQERGRSRTRGQSKSRSKSPSERSKSKGTSKSKASSPKRSKSPVREQPRAKSPPKMKPQRSNSQGAKKESKKSGAVAGAIKSCLNCGKKRK